MILFVWNFIGFANEMKDSVEKYMDDFVEFYQILLSFFFKKKSS